MLLQSIAYIYSEYHALSSTIFEKFLSIGQPFSFLQLIFHIV